MRQGHATGAAGLTTGGVTTAIDRLDRSGYASRVRDTADRRRVIVTPTEKGRAVVAEIFTPLAREGAEYLRGLGPDTLGEMVAFLRFASRRQWEHAARLATGD
ncbi:MarR family winged helix-turn-helix transcriptional regulator [Streptomyces chrestomyceticus]|uniref:MarR family winged helix-turn-helix transcriptional regulator n=1 Tax=Streptomyces chrestomyceticus TaxID=68185 RepID=UPI00067D6485